MRHCEYERNVAVEAVIKACRLCQAVRAGDLFGEIMEKGDRSPVTVADFGAQAIISLDLLKAFPDDPVMAEEALADVGTDLKEKIFSYVRTIFPNCSDEQVFSAIDRCNHNGGPSGRFWVIDPVDGTKGFLRGDQYAIALALIEDGDVVLGVLGCPNFPLDLDRPDGSRGCIFISIKGQGSSVRQIDNAFEKKISVTDIDDTAMASFCESVESSHSSHDKSARIGSILGVKKAPVRIDSQCKYGIVGRGDASIYLRIPSKAGYEEKIWDHTAGWLIVKEAGGEVTDIHGNPLDFSTGRILSHNTGIVATNGKVHAEVIAAIRQVVDPQ